MTRILATVAVLLGLTGSARALTPGTDVRVELQALIDATPSGGLLILPDGDYSVSQAGSAYWGVRIPLGGSASQTVLLIGNIAAAPAANRNIYEGQTGSTIRITSTPRVVAISGANVATGTVSPISTTRPFVYRENFTAATSTVMTDQEKLVPTHGTISGRTLRIGSSATAVASVVGYACAWYSANAEISDANMKALLQAMGFSIPW